MSILTGFYELRESTESLHELIALRSALTGRGPDGVHFQVLPRVAMGYAALNTTTESDSQTQPVNSDGILLAWDGRLDNREDLLHALVESRGTVPDSKLVLNAYLRWGRDFVSQLLGEFAFALWDSQKKFLILGRDAFGIRPLFYHATQDRILWASDVQTLLSVPSVPATVNDEFVSGYLVREPAPSSSPFRQIRALPGAHVLMWDRGNFQESEYWRIDAKREIRYSSDEEYEEQFRTLFREAVRCRLRGNRAVTAELSGGLDSSSIACIADELLRHGACGTPEVQTVSFVHDESSTSDESPYILAVEDKTKKHGWHVLESECRVITPGSFGFAYAGPAPEHIFERHWLRVHQIMQENNSRVLISGHGGDHVLVGDWRAPFDLADCLMSLRLSDFMLKIKGWGQTWPLGPLVWRGAIWPCLPRALRRKMFWGPLPDWLDRSFTAKWNLKDAVLGPLEVESYGFSRPSSREVHASFRSLVDAFSSGYAECFYSSLSITRTFPYLHRPLVEYLAAIPMDQNINSRISKSVLRRSMKGLLPEAVRLRVRKTVPIEAFFRALSGEAVQLKVFSGKPLVCEFGYAEPTALKREIMRAKHGLSQDSASLVRLLSVEKWLQALHNWKRPDTQNQDRVTERFPSPVSIGKVFLGKPVEVERELSGRTEVN